jgi:colicin import membrane protein
MNRIALALALAALAGCATAHRGGSTVDGAAVSEADLGRLSPEQMAPVNQARQQVMAARDELSRATLRQQQVANEQGQARADRTAADADQQRAEAEQKAANEGREPAALQRAQQLQQQASLRRQAADARLDWANKFNAARAAQLVAAQRNVQVAEAQLEMAKLQALHGANIPAAAKYDAGKFQQRMNEAQQAYQQSFAKARQAETDALTAQQRWNGLNQQLQAYLGGRQAG